MSRTGIPPAVASSGRLSTTTRPIAPAISAFAAFVVKAQVLTGGRGKAGGVKLAEDPADAEAKARDILGLDIRGHVVRTLWIEKASDIEREYYLSVTFDRGAKKPLFMFTTQGGVEIEQVADENPEALVRLHVDPLEGFQPWQARRLIYGAGIDDPDEQKQIAAIVGRLYEAFVEFDAMLCEINPLIVTPSGEVRALDSKFSVDDNALFRHPDIADMRESPAVKLIQLLQNAGANVSYHDPYVPSFDEHGTKMSGVGYEPAGYDCVVIATDHRAIDYGELVDRAQLVVDLRNATGDKGTAAANVFKL